MPTRKARKQHKEKQPITVVLTTKERKDLGIELLRIHEGKHRTETLAELDRILGIYASEWANADNVYLRSDIVSLAEPLAKAVDRFWAALQSTDPHVLSMISFKKFVDFNVLEEQMEGLRRFQEWLRKEPSKKGGERRSYVKARKEDWTAALTTWFVCHRQSSPDAKPKKDARKFVRVALAAMERAVVAAAKQA